MKKETDARLSVPTNQLEPPQIKERSTSQPKEKEYTQKVMKVAVPALPLVLKSTKAAQIDRK